MKINRKIRRQPRAESQAGYLLLTIMLMVVIFTIAAMSAAPVLTQQIKRDREEELIHRGVQYSRAVKRYFKKFGTYPTSIEALESTNNMRFLRRRYKDPITGKDFKLLHFGEVQVFNTNTVGTPVSQMGGQTGFPAGMAGPAAMQNSGLSQAALAQQGAVGLQPGMQGMQAQGSDSSQSNTPVTQPQGMLNSNSSNPNQQVFGGGAIVGVASTSDKQGIHEFNKKKKYSEWQFVYDPNLDRGGLIVGPAQPLPGGMGGTVAGQATQPGQQGSNSPFSSQPFSNQPFSNQPTQGPGMTQRPNGMQPQSSFPPDTPPQ